MTCFPQTIQSIEVKWDEVPVVVYQLTFPQKESRAHRVVFLHGLGGSAAQWFDTLSVVSAAGHNSIAFDIIPVEWARVFTHYLPRSTLTLLPECGHFPHLEVPTLFHQYLTQFLVNLIPA